MDLRKLSFFIIILGFFLSLSSLPQKIEMKNKIRNIHNEKEGKWGKDPQVSLKLIRTLGGIDVEDENLAFNSPYDITMDKEGNLYILDNGNGCIQKLDPEGKYLATIGGKGQGPGEFQNPYSIGIDSQGRLYVADSRAKKIHIFNPNGKVHKTVKISKYRIHYARYCEPGLIACGGISRLVSPEEENLPKLIKVFNLKGKLQYEFGDIYDYKDNWVNLWANWFYFDVDDEGNFCLTFRHQNRVEKYSSVGNLIWKADRKLNYDTKPLDKGSTEGRRSRDIPKMNTVSSGVSSDDKGRIWVLTLNRQLLREEEQSSVVSPGGRSQILSEADDEKIDAYKLEIFDSGGILLGELKLSHHAHDIRILKHYLFVWERNNSKFYQYEIVEK